MLKSRGSIGGGLLAAMLLLPIAPAFSAASDDGFKTFWEQFTSAVIKSDQAAVSRMVKYPIYYDGQRQITDFPVIWKGSFKPSQRTCLTKQKAVKDTDPQGTVTYSAFCGQLIYVFGKDGDSWKLTDFGSND
jgi:hypothetical protein